MAITLQGIAGRIAGSIISGYSALTASQSGGLRVTMFDALYQDAVREGCRFGLGINASITGIAPVTTVQTTAAQWVIWNGSATKTMYFTALGAQQTGGTAGTTGLSVNYALITAPAQTGFTTGLAISNLSATSTTTSSAACKASVTVTTPAAPVWIPVAQTNIIAASVGPTLAIGNWQIFGGIACPPTSGVAINVYGPTGTSNLYAPLAEWIELAGTQY